MNFDLDNLTPVTKSVKVSQNFDLRYSGASERFTMGDRFYSQNNMNTNGLTLYVQNGNVLLSVQSNDDSVFYTGKSNSDVKGKLFSYGFLADALVDTGIISDLKEDVKLKANKVGEKDGKVFFHLVPLNEPEGKEESAPEDSEEEVASSTPESEESSSDNFDEFEEVAEPEEELAEEYQEEESDDFDEFDDPDFDNI